MEKRTSVGNSCKAILEQKICHSGSNSGNQMWYYTDARATFASSLQYSLCSTPKGEGMGGECFDYKDC